MNSISSSRNRGQGIYKMIRETFTAGTFPSVAAGEAAPRPTCASHPCTPLLCGPDPIPAHPPHRPKLPHANPGQGCSGFHGKEAASPPRPPDHGGLGRPSASAAPPSLSRRVAQDHLHAIICTCAKVQSSGSRPRAPGSDPWGWCPGSIMGTHTCAMRASQQTDESTHTLHATQPPLKEQFSHGWRYQTMF